VVHPVAVASLTRPARAAITAVRDALANDGIRRLELLWMLGIAADAALLVILLVVVYGEAGALGAGILGAVRMGAAVTTGMLSGALVARFNARRVLLIMGLIRAATAALTAIVITVHGGAILLLILAAILAIAGGPIRPTLASLMPGLARSPAELIAANMAWSTGEGLGTFAGPLVAGIAIALGDPGVGSFIVALTFLGTAIVVLGLRFEHHEDARGGAEGLGGVRLAEGLRTLRRRPVVGWSMLGVFTQVMTRALLGPLAVVAAIELLDMGEPGVGLLNAALGLGGLFGAIFALQATRPNSIIRTQSVALFLWGAPIAAIGLLPNAVVGLSALVLVGVANAVYDVAIFTIFQRGTTNAERSPVFAVFEGVIGLGAVTGSLLAPALLAVVGAREALIISGSILPVVSLVIFLRLRRARRVSVLDDPLAQLIRSVGVFAELPLTAIERLTSGLVPVDFAAGEVLMRQGDPGDRFIVVKDGEIEVSVHGAPVERLGPGSGVGEIALLHRSPRTATVTAITSVSGYAVDAATFRAAVSGPASVAVTERVAAGHLERAGGSPSLALET
jgi:MFS family permease